MLIWLLRAWWAVAKANSVIYSNRNSRRTRAVASVTVLGGQGFHFPHFFLKFRSIFLIFPHTLLIFFLILALRVGESPTREGPGHATEKDVSLYYYLLTIVPFSYVGSLTQPRWHFVNGSTPAEGQVEYQSDDGDWVCVCSAHTYYMPSVANDLCNLLGFQKLMTFYMFTTKTQRGHGKKKNITYVRDNYYVRT